MYKRITKIAIMIIAASTISLAVFVGAAGTRLTKPELKPGPSLDAATGWLNSQPLSLADLRGKVVLVDFWTYTCINWRRTLPYVSEWALKYKDYGLVVIGVHTPEFSFEYNAENVSRSVKEMNINYPTVLDNNYGIWRSFQNNYWPALYLLDSKGKLRYQKFGEGDYAEIEMQIQKLLKETSATNVPDKPVLLQPRGYEAAADWESLASPENFLGYSRTEGFASPGGIKPDKPTLYSIPKKLKLNQWALSGTWTIGKETVRLRGGPGNVVYRFHARDLHLIMGPATPGTSIKFRVLIDGKPPEAAHGLDVDSEGVGTIVEQRMYQLVRQAGPIVDREFQIEFLQPEVEVYDFTFG
jgi:thiol-disulfide isomerase/thioredoxin